MFLLIAPRTEHLKFCNFIALKHSTTKITPQVQEKVGQPAKQKLKVMATRELSRGRSSLFAILKRKQGQEIMRSGKNAFINYCNVLPPLAYIVYGEEEQNIGLTHCSQSSLTRSIGTQKGSIERIQGSLKGSNRCILRWKL